jgi:hypothetical protein
MQRLAGLAQHSLGGFRKRHLRPFRSGGVRRVSLRESQPPNSPVFSLAPLIRPPGRVERAQT